jgi:hypothetical protein
VDGEAQPADDHVFLSRGFEPGKLYELVYTTNRSPVVGCGLLAVRDVASFLRYSSASDNPCAGRLEHVYGFGMSQTGRMLRHFLYLGLNQDEEGRIAYDGLIPHVGGARRGEFNHRYGQPSVQSTPGPGHLQPFSDAQLLARQRKSGSLPKVMQTNSSAEYWRGDCALMHIDDTGTRDLPPEPDTRAYHFAGTQHGPGAVPLTNFNPNDGGRGRYGFNAVDYTPLLRAALVNLDRWVSNGVEPPSSAHPRLSDGTAVERSAVLERFRALPGMHVPDPELLPVLREVDCGPDAARGLPRFPPMEGAAYPALVSAVDVDLNEQAGIRLPHLTAPVASYTGWNPRHPETGSPDQMMPMQGSTFFFARTRAEREASGDPRMSIEDRYQSRNGYLERVRAAAIELAAQRYILEEDIDVVVSDAAARYDTAMGGS